MKVLRKEAMLEKDGLSQPRVLGLREAAQYTGLSYWTLRELVLAGKIPRVVIPNPWYDGRALRRILIDRQDLDKFIDGCKVR
jgi:hypothetical protein